MCGAGEGAVDVVWDPQLNVGSGARCDRFNSTRVKKPPIDTCASPEPNSTPPGVEWFYKWSPAHSAGISSAPSSQRVCSLCIVRYLESPRGDRLIELYKTRVRRQRHSDGRGGEHGMTTHSLGTRRCARRSSRRSMSWTIGDLEKLFSASPARAH
ncbi:hypothetical protein EVAR_77597_1 [Eumeta japonica]|uniref:Uncharacterized protein n=1 Tax=Eumeta variegata TaxID=151549 RepID=A0A4C1T7S9_EUMVA|nr:hypothetical protein EVAR_77597_1 [Eumeta japonica]